MTERVKTYQFENLIVTFGPNILTGFSSGDAIKITADDDVWSKQVGNGGATIRSRKNKPGGQVTLVMQYGVLDNQILAAIRELDKVTGFGYLPLNIIDRNGTFQYFSPQAWIMNNPERSYGEEAGDVEWVLDTAMLQFKEGVQLF